VLSYIPRVKVEDIVQVSSCDLIVVVLVDHGEGFNEAINI